MLEDLSTTHEMCDMYICVWGMPGKYLVGRNHIGTEISMSVLQPMKKLNFGRLATRKYHCVVSTVHATIPTKTQSFIGLLHWFAFRVVGLSVAHYG